MTFEYNTALTRLRIACEHTWRIPNRKKRHGNVTTSKASVADTLHDILVRKGSKGCDDFLNMFVAASIRHIYVTRTPYERE